MLENGPPFDDDCISTSDTDTNLSLSIKRNDNEHHDTEEISPLTNYYVSSGEKRISKNIQKLDDVEAKRLKIIRSLLYEAHTSYTVEYAKQIIHLARYYSKELTDFKLSEKEENVHLENIQNLEKRKFGLESSQIDEMINTIKYVHELEQRLEKKGLMKKKSTNEKIVNRIARKDGDSV